MSTATVVPVENLPYISARVEEYAKRAKRIRCAAPVLVVGERSTERVYIGQASNGDRVYAVREMVSLTVEGERPQVPGWEPVANLVHANGANVVRCRPGFELPESYRTRQVCDHCGTDRRRNDTWVLRNAAGELRQIGRQCMQDFVGSVDVNLAALSLWAETDSFFSNPEEPGMGGARYYSVRDYLGAVAALIREDRGGFVTKKVAQERRCSATADQAFTMLDMSPEQRAKNGFPVAVTADDVAAVNAAMDWCASWDEAGDYPHNVRTAVGMGYVTHKTAGFVASLLGSAYPRAMKAAAERAERAATVPTGGHVGAIGERPTLSVVVEKVRSWASDYGTTTFVAMKDADGNSLVWYASSDPDVKEGDRLTMKATIKKHGNDRYTGGKATTVTRCKILEKAS